MTTKTVAVAGGSSPGLGRSILEALKAEPSLTPVVLSRKSSQTPKWLDDMAMEVRKVDYQSEESLVEALNGVHTVICTLLAKDGTWSSTQINLLNSSIRAGVRRFAPAEFGSGPLAASKIAMFSPQIEVMNACRKAKMVNTRFEYAGFHLGLFMNYLGCGSKFEKEALAGKSDDGEFVWYVKHMKAAIPMTRDGKVPRITMTEIGDVGRFVAAACLLPEGKWEEDFSMVGDTLKMDEVVSIIENIRGQKMEIEWRSFDKIVAEKEKEEHFYKKFWLELEEMNARDTEGEGFLRPRLNELCPRIRPMSVEEYVRKFWS